MENGRSGLLVGTILDEVHRDRKGHSGTTLRKQDVEKGVDEQDLVTNGSQCREILYFFSQQSWVELPQQVSAATSAPGVTRNHREMTAELTLV